MLKFIHNSVVSKQVCEIPHSGLKMYSGLKNSVHDSSSAPAHHGFVGNGYKLNEKGYRSDSFAKISDLNVLTIGCSNAFGFGVRNKHMFSTIFCEELSSMTQQSVSNWNLSLPGRSNDYISRLALAATEVLSPDIYLIAFTNTDRREHFGMSGTCYYVPNNWPNWILPQFKDDYVGFRKLSSPQADDMNFFFNYKLVELLMTCHNKQWLFSSCDKIPKEVDQSHYVGGFHNIDLATDKAHPGQKSHKDLAGRFLSKYRSIYVDSI